MSIIRIKNQQNTSPKAAEVGEVDTRAPFQSVKAAVSLFGDVVTKRKPPSPKKKLSGTELDKETQLLLAQKQLDNIKQQLENAETTRSQALSELDKGKKTIKELNAKIEKISRSKKSAMKYAEKIKARVKNLKTAKTRDSIEDDAWKQELEHARSEYTNTIAQLDVVKQDLTKTRQDFDAALVTKLAAFQQGGEAQRSAKVNSDRIIELQKEIQAIQESIERLKHDIIDVEQEQANVVAERGALLHAYKIAKQRAEEKLLSLKEEVDPELVKNMEKRYEQTITEIEELQKEMKKAHAFDMETVRLITMELDEATLKLQEIAEEESSLRSLVSSLRLEMEDVKREKSELMTKEMEMEALATQLTNDILKTKEDVDRLISQQLLSQTENARLEAENISQIIAKKKREAEDILNSTKEDEKKLKLAQEQVEVAKEAEKSVLEQLKILSRRPQDTSEGTTPIATRKIKLSLKDYECLSRKVKECDRLAEIKEAECIVQLEAINARKNEGNKKLEANLKAIEEIKAATDLTLRNSETAESTKFVIEGELRNWGQEDHTVRHAS